MNQLKILLIKNIDFNLFLYINSIIMTKDAKHLIIEKLFPNENANKIVDKLENKKNYDPKYTSLLGKLNTITIDMIKRISDLTFNKFYIILHLCEDKNRNINDLLSEEAKSNKNILFYKIEGNIDTSSMLNVPITILYNKNSIIKGWYIGTNLIKIKNVTNVNKTKVNYAKNLNISIKSNKIIIDFISYESVYKYGALAVAGTVAGTAAAAGAVVAGTAAAAGAKTAVKGIRAVDTAGVATAATNLGYAPINFVKDSYDNVQNYSNLCRIIFNEFDNYLHKAFEKLTGGASISNMLKDSSSGYECLLFKNLRKYYGNFKSNVLESYSVLRRNVHSLLHRKENIYMKAFENWFRTILEIYILQEFFKTTFQKYEYKYSGNEGSFSIGNGISVFVKQDENTENLTISKPGLYSSIEKTYSKPDKFFYKFDMDINDKIKDIIKGIKEKINNDEIYKKYLKYVSDDVENFPDNYLFFKIHEPDIANQTDFLLKEIKKLVEKIHAENGYYRSKIWNPLSNFFKGTIYSLMLGDFFKNFFLALAPDKIGNNYKNFYPSSAYEAINSFNLANPVKSGLLLLITLGNHLGFVYNIRSAGNKFVNSLKNVLYSPDYVKLVRYWQQLIEIKKKQTLYLKGFSVNSMDKFSKSVDNENSDDNSLDTKVNYLYFENNNISEYDESKPYQFEELKFKINTIKNERSSEDLDLTEILSKANEYIYIIDILKDLDFIDPDIKTYNDIKSHYLSLPTI